MNKFQVSHFMLSIGTITGWGLFLLASHFQNPDTQFIPYPQPKPIIIEFKDDCYASKDFTHEILSAKDTQELLKQLNDRKLK